MRPVLATHCMSCHTQAKLGGLEMVSREALLKGGNSGPAINLERPEESLLVKAVRHTHERLKMPPNGKLKPQQIDDIVHWIGRGAPWPSEVKKPQPAGYSISDEQRKWWAFQPVRKPQAGESIDYWIRAELAKRGLKQVKPARKRQWIRRASYDLIGLPPTVEQVEAFVKETSPQARARVIDQLLTSPHFGERWGRHWLDVARYSDDLLNSTQDEPYDNAFRYRDWVIRAFNQDMPYDRFVKAQIAGDLMDDKERYVAGLGFYALSPQFQDDRVDVTGKAFLGLTLGCAQCHDHKFDPVPTRDYYALLGVFTSTQTGEFPLAPEAVVAEYRKRKEAVEAQQAKLERYLDDQAKQLAEVLAHRAADYLRAARKGPGAAEAAGLDAETLKRLIDYLKTSPEHPFLNEWRDESRFDPEAFQRRLLAVLEEQKEIEKQNMIRLGGSNARGDLARADLLSLPRDKYILFRDFFDKQRGIFYYQAGKIDRFLSGEWKAHADRLRAELEQLKKALPERYPYYHIIRDRDKPKNERIRIRGSADNLGEEAPRGFLTILSPGQPRLFRHGSGRLELAEAIASRDNPLTARVMANRIWGFMMGAGIVRTPSNFGQLGEKPSHPELLDYLAWRLMESGWSVKALIREIALSDTYALGYAGDARNWEVDPDNRLLWRAARRRLDIESLRDALLAASGELDLTMGGKPLPLSDPKNLRRTVYGFISRRKLDPTLALFDFPNPNATSEQRIPTSTPLQQLFFLNSEFLIERAKAFAARLAKSAPDDAARIRQAYRILFQRDPDQQELSAALDYLKAGPSAWPLYAQVLMSSNEFLYY